MKANKTLAAAAAITAGILSLGTTAFALDGVNDYFTLGWPKAVQKAAASDGKLLTEAVYYNEWGNEQRVYTLEYDESEQLIGMIEDDIQDSYDCYHAIACVGGRIVSDTIKESKDGETTMEYSYSYDGAGNLTSVKGAAEGEGREYFYTYADGYLVHIASDYWADWGKDGSEQDLVITPVSGGIEVTRESGTVVSFDADGNFLGADYSDGSIAEAVYDEDGQLSEVSLDDSPYWTFAYTDAANVSAAASSADTAAAASEDSVTAVTKETIAAVQEALNEAGFDCGTADGIAGAKTTAGISAYQEANGLTVTGQIDDELLAALGISE